MTTMTTEELDAKSVSEFNAAVWLIGASDSPMLLSSDDRERDEARLITWARLAWMNHNRLCGEDPARAHEFAERIAQFISGAIDEVAVDG